MAADARTSHSLQKAMASRLAVVAFPELSASDRLAIQAIRARHDPQFALLDPHFTLLFPIEASVSDVIDEARSAANLVSAFSVMLNSIRAVRDALSDGGHVLLLADQGAKEIAILHSALYSRTLNWALRKDIPYVPHITIAACTDFSECEELALRLTGDRRDMYGFVVELAVLEVTEGRVATVATLPLRSKR